MMALILGLGFQLTVDNHIVLKHMNFFWDPK